MLGVLILALTTSLIYDFGVFPAVWHVLLLILLGSALSCGLVVVVIVLSCEFDSCPWRGVLDTTFGDSGNSNENEVKYIELRRK
jgi:hypothetical protein